MVIDEISEEVKQAQVVEGNEELWRARRDSNFRPIAPEDSPHDKSTT